MTSRPGPALKLTDEVHAKIVEQLASGCTLEVAARAAGVTKRTLASWLAKGRDAEQAEAEGRRLTADARRCLALLYAAEEARAKVEVRALATIRKAMVDGTWQAAAWYLERTHPDRYAAKRRPNAGGRPAGAVSAPDRVAEPPRLARVK